jgi:pyruvate dehydrogenase E1 component
MCDRWNMLHPSQKAKVPYVAECLNKTDGVIVAASDYVKALPNSVDRWTPRKLRSLGTVVFGRSEDRAALRQFFEVDARFITVATLAELLAEGQIEAKVVAQAIKDLGIDPDKRNPAVS